MKCVVAILAVALASQCLALPVNDEYADLIQAVLTYAKQQLTEHDPMSLPDVKDEKIQDENVNLIMSQTNTQLSKASTFTVEKVSTDPSTMSATVQLNIPQFIQSGNYEISGTAYNRTVSGQGTISVTLQDFDQTVEATLVNPDTSLQLSNLVLDYDLKSVQVSVTGLTIEGMTEEQVQQFITNDFTALIMGQKAQVEKLTAAVAQSKINELIAGKTLAEVVAWVKSQIHQ
ncbi:hypothetical protein GE061_011371 [Apolygus lucorum]|uniref:Lipid-binding serum glycoprotein N-terminal domain-containing protein n=1 Tax=Apolygus lucorum TaxID=248454 RepID=A0A6A4K594_APOLU|nr:hypothetical protein GE061_011371 [Apolygus lucorum]